MTASLRARATLAFLAPLRLAIFMPQALKVDHRPTRVSRTLAASYRYERTSLSPHFEIRPM